MGSNLGTTDSHSVSMFSDKTWNRSKTLKSQERCSKRTIRGPTTKNEDDRLHELHETFHETREFLRLVTKLL